MLGYTFVHQDFLGIIAPNHYEGELLIYNQAVGLSTYQKQASDKLLKGALQGHSQHSDLVCHKGSVFFLRKA